MGTNKTSWLEYMGELQLRSFTPKQLQTEGLDRLLHTNQFTHSVFNHSIPWVYLLDYTSGKYLLVSKSMKVVLGFEPEYFLDGGLDLTLEKYQPDHLRLFNEEIFPDRLGFLKKIPPDKQADYIFSYNFQFKTKKGDYVNLLQRNCFVKSDEKGNPLLSFGIITNVNHFKTASPVIQVVEKVNDKDYFGGTEPVMKKAYFLNGEDRLFTKREKELLPWMADGLTSKEIADKLYISEFTVNNHRRNMMEKCNAKNVTELVSFAFRNRLL